MTVYNDIISICINVKVAWIFNYQNKIIRLYYFNVYTVIASSPYNSRGETVFILQYFIKVNIMYNILNNFVLYIKYIIYIILYYILLVNLFSLLKNTTFLQNIEIFN